MARRRTEQLPLTHRDERVGALLREGRHRLAPVATAALDAEVLLARVLEVDRPWLFANGEFGVAAEAAAAYRDLIRRRGRGEPVAYLTGLREFWSMPLRVTPDVLIPRPETELLVEAALDFIPLDSACRAADLGTGSGAVALAIARERPLCEVHATEHSAAALEVARENIAALAAGRVILHLGSWLDPLRGSFRVIVSNPPYVAEDDPHLQEGDCRFEPREALTPGPDGLKAIRAIARAALPCLDDGGVLAFEHGFDQGEAARALLAGLNYRAIETRRDLEGWERVTLGRRSR